uniref:Uncharacterized protein n=1 Tax=Lepeophtheirus salmonis TaxID=72036 RepID=A0A0K2TGI7_LEPSM
MCGYSRENPFPSPTQETRDSEIYRVPKPKPRELKNTLVLDSTWRTPSSGGPRDVSTTMEV